MPPTVRAGTIVHFTVTLHNTSGQPYSLNPCPAYETGFYASDGARIDRYYRLNCSTAHEIPGHGSLTYAMQLPAPANVATAMTMKFWWSLQSMSYRFIPADSGGGVTVTN